MYLRVSYKKKNMKNKQFLFASLKSLKKIVGSVSQRVRIRGSGSAPKCQKWILVERTSRRTSRTVGWWASRTRSWPTCSPCRRTSADPSSSSRQCVADPGCCIQDPDFYPSRIPDPDFYPSQIRDPTTAPEEEGKKNLFVLHFV
jgi:hypothetical protein